MVYKYNNKRYNSEYELSRCLYLDTTFFAKEIKNENFLSFIKSKSESKYNKIIRLSKLPYPDDVLVFKLSYILNPNMPFCFAKIKFKSFKELGNMMINSSPNFNPTLMQIVTYGLISSYMKLSDFKNYNKDVYSKIVEYEAETATDSAYAYFLIAYYLSEKQTIIFNNVEYPDLYSFIYYLNNQERNKNELGELLAHSAVIRAYAKLGKEKDKVEKFIHINSELEKSESLLNNVMNKSKY